MSPVSTGEAAGISIGASLGAAFVVIAIMIAHRQYRKKHPTEHEFELEASTRLIPIAEWTVNDVCLWLRFVHLRALSKQMRDKDVNGERLMALTTVDVIRGLGITDADQQTRLIAAVTALLEYYESRAGEAPTGHAHH